MSKKQKTETIDEFMYRLQAHGLENEFRDAAARLSRSLQLPRKACFPIAYMQFTDRLCLQEQILLRDKA